MNQGKVIGEVSLDERRSARGKNPCLNKKRNVSLRREVGALREKREGIHGLYKMRGKKAADEDHITCRSFRKRGRL